LGINLRYMKTYLLLFISLLFSFCSDTKKENKKTTNINNTANISEEIMEPIFSLLTSQETGIDFTNYNKENNDFNYYSYEYFYNGGGVATADFNNDGLLDIVFTANMAPNKLYINTGNLRFQDVTKQANINSNTQDWCTGVTIVDINNDGYQDIFISRSGWFEDDQEDKLSNLLFVNNKDLTFTEKSAVYGFTDLSRSNQACFF
jgi:hypothetical protein